MSEHVSLNIDPDEVIAPSTVIEVQTSRAMDPKSAQNSIWIRGVPVTIELAEGSRLARVIVPDELPVGSHRLVVNELLDTKGAGLEELMVCPFVVADLPDLSGDMRVEHMTQFRVDELQVTRIPLTECGERVARSVKAVDRNSGEPAELALDEDGRAIDPGELRAAVEKRRLERFGKLEEALARRIEGAKDDEMVPVSIWARIEAPLEFHDKSADGPTRERPTAEEEGRRAGGGGHDAAHPGSRAHGHQGRAALWISADGRGGDLGRTASRPRP
jgi:hypothetical protein